MPLLKPVLLYFILLVSPLIVAALPETVTVDSLPEYQLRAPGEEFLQQFREDPSFNYTTVQLELDWWKRLKWWILKHIFRKHEVVDAPWLDWVLRIAAGLLIAFVIYKIVRSKYLFAPSGKTKSLQGIDTLIGEQLNPVSYLQLVDDAVAKGDFAMAIRIHYWYVLYLMDEKGVIRWDVHKTNLSYWYEIKDEQLRQKFGRLTHIFDCVCYGEFHVDADLYKELSAEFKDVLETKETKRQRETKKTNRDKEDEWRLNRQKEILEE